VLSAIALAELLDHLNTERRAYVTESGQTVTVSNLSFGDARDVLLASGGLNWRNAAYDAEGSEWAYDTLPPEFEPFRVEIRKPEHPDHAVLRILTNEGFGAYLKVGNVATHWQIARLAVLIETRGRRFSGWSEALVTLQPSSPAKNPRFLVRELSVKRLVPEDIRPWLLLNDDALSMESDTVQVWVNAAIEAILPALADETEDQSLRFKGPPRLSLSLQLGTSELAKRLGANGFHMLQRAANWVFENDREAEMRHILLATEIARSGVATDESCDFMKKHISIAFDGAKIAYQVSLSDVGRDTLKILADLRKAVTEETAKVTDATRQLAGAVAGALAAGMGLMAARVSTAVPPWLILAVACIIVAYVGSIILSGMQFIRLQRQLRRDWQPRLYHFLPAADYRRMVTDPALKAETAFHYAAAIGGLAVVTLALLVAFNGNASPPDKRVTSAKGDERRNDVSASSSVMGQPSTLRGAEAAKMQQASGANGHP
jgi:hypothetical protein